MFKLLTSVLISHTRKVMVFPQSSIGKESACNAGDPGSVPRLGRFPGVGHGNPLQYSCLENSMDRGGWWATVHGVTKSLAQMSELIHTQQVMFKILQVRFQ